MTTIAPLKKIAGLLLPKKASPAHPGESPFGDHKKIKRELNRATADAVSRNQPFDDITDEWAFKHGFHEGFNAGMKYAIQLLNEHQQKTLMHMAQSIQ